MKTEFGEAAEPAPAGTIGSATMPHKRNPQPSDDCVTIGAQVRAVVPLALEGNAAESRGQRRLHGDARRRRGNGPAC
jgi:adenylosuccinate lyase